MRLHAPVSCAFTCHVPSRAEDIESNSVAGCRWDLQIVVFPSPGVSRHASGHCACGFLPRDIVRRRRERTFYEKSGPWSDRAEACLFHRRRDDGDVDLDQIGQEGKGKVRGPVSQAASSRSRKRNRPPRRIRPFSSHRGRNVVTRSTRQSSGAFPWRRSLRAPRAEKRKRSERPAVPFPPVLAPKEGFGARRFVLIETERCSGRWEALPPWARVSGRGFTFNKEMLMS